MRISELVENPLQQISTAFQKGQQQPAQNPLAKIQAAYQQGQGAATKSADINDLDIKTVVQSVLQGNRVYEKDLELLNTLRAQIKSGQRSTKQDSAQLSLALKTAVNAQSLNDQQKSLLTNFLQEL